MDTISTCCGAPIEHTGTRTLTTAFGNKVDMEIYSCTACGSECEAEEPEDTVEDRREARGEWLMECARNED